jgi:hypothetical protein
LIISLLFGAVGAFSQAKLDSLIQQINPYKWSVAIEKKASKIERKLQLQSQQTLKRLQSQEEKIYERMLRGADSIQARASLAEVRERYSRLRNRLQEGSGTRKITLYIPRLDTIRSTLQFLDLRMGGDRLQKALSATQGLEDRFQQAGEIKNFIRERKAAVQAQLEHLGLAKELKQFNKKAYYYSEQIKEYGEVFKDSKKAQKKAIEILSHTKIYQDFIRKNSLLASLFRLPGQDPSDPVVQASLAGLQTRSQVNSLIQQQISTGGPSAMNQFKQQISEAQNEISQLKNKLGESGANSSDDIRAVGFKPNHQKTKSFFKRLEYGTNFQTQPATSLLPVTSDIGLSVGYKLNDKSVIGLGASYKLGWGCNWNNVSISSQGLGFRSYLDWKIKGSVSASGGYEQNYRSAFRDIDQLRDWSAWQQSGLVGLSKIFSIKSKFFKNCKMQLLWDFLSSRQIPKTQPLVFRIGYN